MTNYEKDLIEKLNRLIQEKYINTESITDNLCVDLGISRSNLYRMLKDNFQLSPSLYIRKQKLSKAKELLASSELKIGEVAYYIGLDSPQNFTKYFTHEFGINPTEFRRKKLEAKVNKAKEESIKVAELKEPKHYTPPTRTLQKPKLKENLSFFLPGLIVFILTALGFFYWQKSYFNDDKTSETQLKQSIAIIPFDCFGFATKSTICENLNTQFFHSFSKIENVGFISKPDSLRYISTNDFKKEVYQKLSIKYILTGNIINLNNSTVLKIEIMDALQKNSIWNKTYKLASQSNEAELEAIITELSDLFKDILKVNKNGKFYLIPNRNMNTYKQYLQSSQLVFDWNNFNYIQK
ncbi:MAG: AraC family transcriptional regulator [Bacteroidota bacterium]